VTVGVSACVCPAVSVAVVGDTVSVVIAIGTTVTDTVVDVDAAENPVLAGAVAVTVMVAVPVATAEITPAADTVATAGSVVP
jgi:hypothetical protein